MSYILVIQSTYESIEAALFKDKQRIDSLFEDKHSSGRLLVPGLDILFKKNDCSFEKLKAIGINCGPAPFTSLRILLATMNGIGLAKKIPLITIDGITLFLHEFANSDFDYTVAVFNAYNNDVHFGIQSNDRSLLETGCMNIDALAKHLQEICNGRSVFFIGSGLDLFRSYIEAITSFDTHINDSYPRKISLDYLYQEVEKKIDTAPKDFTYEVFPLHLKELAYKKKN